MEIDELLHRCRVALGKADLPARADSNLSFLADAQVGGERIMLDPCVILDQLQGKLPQDIEERIRPRAIYHSPVVLGELAFPFCRLDPNDPRTLDAVREVRSLLASIGTHWIFDLTQEDTMRGMVLAGCMARILGHNKEERGKAPNDAILAAQASRLGCLIVTRNVGNFNRIGQLDDRVKAVPACWFSPSRLVQRLSHAGNTLKNHQARSSAYMKFQDTQEPPYITQKSNLRKNIGIYPVSACRSSCRIKLRTH